MKMKNNPCFNPRNKDWRKELVEASGNGGGAKGSMTPPQPQPQQEYIITEEMLRYWKNQCVAQPAHTNTDECKACQYRGKGARKGCCDFDDSDMEKIFCSRPRTSTPANEIPLCLCKSCVYSGRCGFEAAKIHEQNTSTCDDDCKHGRWYIDNTGKLLCDRICIHTVDNFVCPFEQHDTAIRNAMIAGIPDILICQSLPNEHGFCGVNDCFCKEIHRVESGDVCKWMQSLRTQQEQKP